MSFRPLLSCLVLLPIWTRPTFRPVSAGATSPEASNIRSSAAPWGELNRKLTVLVDGHGRALQLNLAPGQRADICPPASIGSATRFEDAPWSQSG